ncbi:hypothetical protein E4633_11335 [Geomonas terrae]|uniref:Right handed beta helix domain-containing protein n=1 Tax=Geomonas terrae TaxID=2562681 RepID=A0A4V3NZT2_9BACT|nr:right-handed parallel beta-helix repeat-containing protein [Geomonas terrae]TGU70452.1 hypothetical protein E4633_15725 [Geomonas terrae]TGU72872.1 hypothetical protein E4633_11335 [Geomonas terrae]
MEKTHNLINGKAFITFAIIAHMTLFSSVLSASAADHYVAPTGSATWALSVSQSTPCSVSTAIANAAAGDTVYFFPGTYATGMQSSNYHIPILNPSNSGTAGAPIVFKSLVPFGAILQGTPYTGTQTAAIIGAYNKTYVTWDGFIVTTQNSSTAALVQIDNSNYITIQNCELIGGTFSNSGNNVAGVIVLDSSYCSVNNNYIHGYIDPNNNHNTAGIWTCNSVGNHFFNNTFYNNTENIYSKYKSDSDVYNNNLLGPLANLSTNANFYVQNYNGLVTSLSIYQNIVIGGGYGISLDTSQNAGNTAKIYNNTFYGQSIGAMGVGTKLTTTWSFYNNIVAGSPQQSVIWTYSAANPGQLDFNNYYSSGKYSARVYDTVCTATTLGNWQTTCKYDLNSVTTDPGFVNPGGNKASDYKRKSYPSNGINGSVMGAYLTGTEVIGVSVIPPRNLGITTVQ